ncbi:MAG: hypothetical protein JWO06_1927 [Bacteroidota bacterium]|nr:hypothetical protein [Bacteroidota bacterium]
MQKWRNTILVWMLHAVLSALIAWSVLFKGEFSVVKSSLFHFALVLRSIKDALIYVLKEDYSQWVVSFHFTGIFLFLFLRVVPFGILIIWVYRRTPFKKISYAYHSFKSFALKVKGLIIYDFLEADVFVLFLIFFSSWMISQMLIYLIAQQKMDYLVLMEGQFVQGKIVVWGCYLFALIAIIARWQSFKSRCKRFWGHKIFPHGLSLFRILFFLEEIQVLFYDKTVLIHRVAPPGVPLQPMEFTGWYANLLPANQEIYSMACILAIVASAFVVLGFMTRLSLITLTVLAFYVYAMPNMYGKINHNHIHLWIPLILIFTPCAEVWSLDALINRWRGNRQIVGLSSAYWQPLAAIYMILGVMYTFSGLRKLWDCGFAWGLSDHFIYQIQEEWIENYKIVPALRIDHYPTIAKAGGMGIVIFEILYLGLIFYPVGRWIACIGGLALHNLAGYFMNIDFADLQKVYFSYLTPLVKRKESFYGQIDSLKSSYKFYFILVILLTGNIVMSLWGKTSWPFSPYPSYSTLAPGTTTIIKFEALAADGTRINIDSLAQTSGFRKETFRPLEEELIRIKDSDTAILQRSAWNLWSNWSGFLPPLAGFKKVEVYAVTFPVAPERYNEIVKKELLTTLDLKN